MIPQHSLSILVIALLLAFASATLDEDHDSVRFSYSGQLTGPSNWGGLTATFSACASGKHQSPVNIITKQTILNRTLEPLAKNYSTAANATLINFGFVIGVHYEANVGDLVIDGKKYSLKQMHWHTPAEHQIDGQKFPAELHIVHEADDRSAAVVAILHKYGSPDPLVKKIEKHLGKMIGSSSEGVKIAIGKLDTKQMRRNTLKYYRYKGSFTTPPCTETVVWSVLGKVRSISKQQVEALKAPLAVDSKNNARPLRPLNDRTIELFRAGSGHHHHNYHH